MTPKLLIASDIHGSATYCAQLREAFAREQADRLVLLGDLLYHGPRNDLPAGYNPREVIAMLNPLAQRIVAVRGNCDAEVDQMVLDFPMMADYVLLQGADCTLFVTHGHLFHPQNPPKGSGYVLLHGHTHVPAFARYAHFTYVNPGSVALPKEDSPRGYLTLQGNVLCWKTLQGDVTRKETL